MFPTCNSQYDHRSSKKVDIINEELGHESPLDKKPEEQSKLHSPNLVGFNETHYLLTAPKDKDAYKKNAFNQEASDKLGSSRSIPDSRNRA